MLLLLLLRNKLSCLVPCCYNVTKSTFMPSSHHHLISLHLGFSTQSAAQGSPPQPHFMVEYLTHSLGFSPEKATKASKLVTHLKSTKNPDSVLSFLRDQGFNEAQVSTIIAGYPRLLCASVEETLKPNVKVLLDTGLLSRPVLARLIVSSPMILHLRKATLRIRFWKSFFGDDERKVLKACTINTSLIGQDIVRNIGPKIALLKKMKFSDHKIEAMILTIRKFITSSVALIKARLRRAKDLGFSQNSGMFIYGLFVVTSVRKEMMERKMEVLKSFGWSECELLRAIQKNPTIFMLSEQTMREKIVFLMEEVGCEQSYIALRPVLLTYSLEKRLRPRHHVLQILKLKGLATKENINYYMNLSDMNFLDRVVLSHEKQIPELSDAYHAACGERIPIQC